MPALIPARLTSVERVTVKLLRPAAGVLARRLRVELLKRVRPLRLILESAAVPIVVAVPVHELLVVFQAELQSSRVTSLALPPGFWISAMTREKAFMVSLPLFLREM